MAPERGHNGRGGDADRMTSGPRRTEAKPEAVAEADREEDAYVIQRTCELLAHIAVIVNGPEPPLTRWSYHDLPEKVRALKDAQQATEAERDRLRSDIREIYDVIPMLPITAETADAATDVFTKFCIDFHQVLNAAAPDGAAGGG